MKLEDALAEEIDQLRADDQWDYDHMHNVARSVLIKSLERIRESIQEYPAPEGTWP
jgi:hypothetical protein